MRNSRRHKDGASLRDAFCEGSFDDAPRACGASAAQDDGPGAGKLGIALRVALVAVLACALVVLPGCRPTDALKEIVLDSSAEVVDEDTAVTVNSPFATEEADWLPAIEKTKDSRETDETTNIAVFGSDPSSALPTYNSIFDTDPLFKGLGVESSLAVSLYASSDKSAVDGETADDNELANANSQKTSKDSKKEQGEEGDSNNSDEQTASSESDEPTEGQGSSNANSNNKNKKDDTGGGEGNGGNGTSDDEGDTKEDTGGYGGVTKTYAPDELLEENIPQADSIAAIGQAAVMVQAIGGKGALCAMDEYTYEGKDENGNKATASSFKKVFGDELADGFKKDALLWSGNGQSKKLLKDSDKLAEACGEGGVIMVCSDDVNTERWFSVAQAEKLNNANITVLTISLTTAQGIEEAATVIGKVLKGSSAAEQDAEANAKAFRTAFDDIITACADLTNDGKFAGRELFGSYHVWNGGFENPSSTTLTGLVATAYGKASKYRNSNIKYSIDVSDGILFTDAGYANSPVSMYMQAAGVFNKAAFYGKNTATSDVYPIWQYNAASDSSNFTGADDIFSRISTASTAPDYYRDLVLAYDPGSMDVVFGLGCRYFPYLIVSGDGATSGKTMKSSFVKSSQTKWGAYYTWSMNYKEGESAGAGWLGTETSDGTKVQSYIGYNGGGENQSVFGAQGKLKSIEDNVRVNPCGLVGSWTGCSMESVLETLWITGIYSEDTSTGYEADYSMDDFQVKIGDTTCSTVKEAVCAFYSQVYRYDASGDYKDVVTDGSNL